MAMATTLPMEVVGPFVDWSGTYALARLDAPVEQRRVVVPRSGEGRSDHVWRAYDGLWLHHVARPPEGMPKETIACLCDLTTGEVNLRGVAAWREEEPRFAEEAVLAARMVSEGRGDFRRRGAPGGAEVIAQARASATRGLGADGSGEAGRTPRAGL